LAGHQHAFWKISLEIEVKPSAKIKRHLNKRFIHGQAKAIPPNSHFIAKGNADGLTKRNRAILDRVMRINLKVTGAIKL
jgi:hypothetical protein